MNNVLRTLPQLSLYLPIHRDAHPLAKSDEWHYAMPICHFEHSRREAENTSAEEVHILDTKYEIWVNIFRNAIDTNSAPV